MTKPSEQEVADYIAQVKMADFYEYQLENATFEVKMDADEWLEKKYRKVERREYHFVEMEALLQKHKDYPSAITQLIASNATRKTRMDDCLQDFKRLETERSQMLETKRKKYANELS